MLVALALVSTIVTMVYGSFTATSRSLDLYGSRLACYERTSMVLRLMARQLRCAYLPSFGTDPTATSRQNGATLAPAATLPIDALAVTSETLSFITTAGLGPGAGRSTALSRVMYQYHPSAGTLSVYCEPCVYGVNDSQDPQRWRPVLSGVRSLEVSFCDGQQWQSGWIGGGNKTLPQAVKIALTVLDEKNRPHTFETMVPIGCRSTPPKQRAARPAGKL